MEQKTLFGSLLGLTYDASGTRESIERYYASMFNSYYTHTDSQPGCAAVQAILQGKTRIPRKLLHHYRDPNCPRCPRKLQENLSALTECCFLEASSRRALRNSLEAYLQSLPQADREDLLDYISDDDLIRLWTVLTWYALCGDRHE